MPMVASADTILNQALPAPENTQLAFNQSRSQIVGVTGKMLDQVKRNADNVFGSLNGLGDIIFFGFNLATGASLPILAASALYLAGNIPMLMSGKQKYNSLEEMAKNPYSGSKTATQKAIEDTKKIFNPSKYPVESASGFGLAAGLIFTGVGITGLITSPFSWVALLTTALGAIEIGSRGLEIYSDDQAERLERKVREQKNLQFESSTSSAVAIQGSRHRLRDWIEEHSEKIVGVTCIASSAAMVGIGLASAPVNLGFLIAGSLYIASYSLYTFFVHRERDEGNGLPNASTLLFSERPDIAKRSGQLSNSFVDRLQLSRQNAQQAGLTASMQ